MKKLIVVAIVCLAFIGGALFLKTPQYPDLFLAQPGQETPLNVNYKFNASTNQIPSKEKIYKVMPPAVNETEAKKLALNFGVDGSVAYQENTKNFVISNGNKIFEVNKDTGFFSYADNDKLHNIDIQKNIPDDEKVKLIAADFLKEKGLLPGRFSNVKVVSQTTGSELQGDLRTISKDVWFYPVIDGKQVYGISRIIITVGNEGEIEGVNKYHRDFEFHAEAPLKSVQTAFDEVKNGKASNSIPPKATEASIVGVEIGYWEDPDATYLQPVYVFVGETKIDGKLEKFDAVVPAVEGVSIESPKTSGQEYESTPKPQK